MKRTRIIGLIPLLLLFTGGLSAQDEASFSKKIGFGASLFNYGELASNGDEFYSFPTSIYLTLDLAKKLRLEPTFGVAVYDKFTDYNLGLGAFYMNRKEKFDLMYGMRFNYTSGETINISPTIGGEYHFIPQFSLSSEVNLMILSYKNSLVNERKNAMLTNARVIARFYFGR